jgi:hypothetical protein
MIRKSVQRFSEEIMLNNRNHNGEPDKDKARPG